MVNVDILKGEFIGKEVKIPNKRLEGKIIDETKNSFLIKMKNNKRKRLMKLNLVFQLKTDKSFVSIEGNSILMKPDDRVKIKETN